MYDEDAADRPIDDPVADGVEQFQRAALDVVRATRAMLDAAETVIKDPKALDSVVRTMTSFARTAGETVMGFASGAETGASTTRTPADTPRSREDDGQHRGFERIQVD